MTRDALIANAVRDIRIEARIAGLRRIAAEASATYRELIEHGVPEDAVRGYFSVAMLRERLNEKREPSRRSAP